MSALLQARSLAFGYAAGEPLFRDIDLDVRPGEIVAVLGASGCGKSSLLRVLAALASPSAGEVRFDGRRLAEPHPRVALLFQQPSLLPWLDVERNVAFGLDFAHQPVLDAATRRRRAATALEAVGLAQAARSWPAQLSGGMAQRVALARALAREPLLLLADEPFSALDAITRGEMQALLVDVARRFGAAVVLVTHDIDEALAVADRVLLMAHGGWRGDWTPQPPRSAQQGEALRPAIRAALQGARATPQAFLSPN